MKIAQIEQNRLLSPHDLASALGVSESSVKRWADHGKLKVTKTAGGHRRITVVEAIRFVRETHAPLLKPELLGLEDLAVLSQRVPATGDSTERLYELLRTGAEVEVRGLVFSLYLEGHSIAEIIDGPLRGAMERVGELWHHSEAGIFHEHRATDVCLQALSQLRLALRPPPGAPYALGGAPAGDPYLLPSLAAATILLAEGFQAVNLGPSTPFESLEKAIEELEPQLVWLSISVPLDPEALRTGVRRLLTRLRPHGATLLVGGRQKTRLDLEPDPHLYLGTSMGELAALARGLRLAAGR